MLGAGGRWACRQSKIEKESRIAGSLPPCRSAALSNLEHLPARQRGWQGQVTPCPLPTGTYPGTQAALGSEGGTSGGLDYLAYWSSDRKIAETETWKGPLCALSVTHPSTSPIQSIYAHPPPFRIVNPPSHNKSGLLGLFLSFVPCQSSSRHHITSPRIAHRIASQLPSVDISASRPVHPIDFFFFAFAFRQDD